MEDGSIQNKGQELHKRKCQTTLVGLSVFWLIMIIVAVVAMSSPSSSCQVLSTFFEFHSCATYNCSCAPYLLFNISSCASDSLVQVSKCRFNSVDSSIMQLCGKHNSLLCDQSCNVSIRKVSFLLSDPHSYVDYQLVCDNLKDLVTPNDTFVQGQTVDCFKNEENQLVFAKSPNNSARFFGFLAFILCPIIFFSTLLMSCFLYTCGPCQPCREGVLDRMNQCIQEAQGFRQVETEEPKSDVSHEEREGTEEI
jgi:hypothetical protein